MSLERFSSMEEARQALWISPGDAGLAARIRRLWAFAARLAPGAGPRGLRRFRTLDEANRDRDAWIERRARALRAARLRP